MIVGVVLAAGGSTRMGRPKQLLPLGGSTLVAAAVRPFLAAPSVDRVVVVVGHHAEAVMRAAAIDERVTIVENRCWREGMASSIRAGVRAVPPRTSAILLGLGDQPGVPPRVIERLCARYQELRPWVRVVIPTFRRRRGHPVLFAGTLRRALAELDGDVGARGLIQSLGKRVVTMPVRTGWVLRDVDTPADYDALGGQVPRA